MTPCQLCPLRRLPLFLPHSAAELELVRSLKKRERRLRPGELLIHEGQSDTSLFTVLEGWACRFKTLSDGRRQILNFLLAGDFVGVQQKMSADAAHGVTALTDLLVCVFERDALWTLHQKQPSMGFNVTWITAHEESLVDDNLLSIGRRSAQERVATMLVILYKRARALLPTLEAGTARPPVPFPLTQQDMADALGLSLAHTNKTLRELASKGLYRIEQGRLWLLDPAALQRMADLYGDGVPTPRPLV